MFPKTTSRVLPINNWFSVPLEVVLLLAAGVVAIILHSKLRIPLHLAGRQGLIFMAILVFAKLNSRFIFSSGITCSGSAALLMTGFAGFDDPYIFMVYIALGLQMDGLFSIFSGHLDKKFIVALLAGTSWAFIPLFRLFIGELTGFTYHSLLTGVVFPVATHFAFGFAGGLIAIYTNKALKRNK